MNWFMAAPVHGDRKNKDRVNIDRGSVDLFNELLQLFTTDEK